MSPPQLPALDRQLGGRRVLVTGGSGSIGSRVVEELCRAGAQVVSVDRRPPWWRSPVSCRVEECDIRTNRLAELIVEFAPDCATTWRCSAKRCLFTDPDPSVVSQHEHDAHGPAWMAAEAPQQPTTKVVGSR
ncbi:NAD-dependent epimerase/dehydratase family protein [Saccharopolyspora spinosa]|uniref:NAD-dependent epimerase/dehydratase family protein n=1 Tax=Saccharopolyspora spinosa TaxID=60894 RepID=UPI000A2F8194|nr:NAD-dependent epimerase/dehydratase family protein [Saccharopolyspora spinosa]